jgi:hypothetical protein
MVDWQIRSKHTEYCNALHRKSLTYGFYNPSTQNVELTDDYYLAKPTGWCDHTMGTWPHGPPNQLTLIDTMPSQPPLLHRIDRVDRVAWFNSYFVEIFEKLLNARNQIKMLETSDIDVQNTLCVMHYLIKTNDHRLGKSEIIRNILDFMGTMSKTVTMQHMRPPKSVLRRAKSN